MPLQCVKSNFGCIRFLKPIVLGGASNFVKVLYLMLFTKDNSCFVEI